MLYEVGSQHEQISASYESCCSLLSAYILLSSSFRICVLICLLFARFTKTLHIMWTNILLSVTIQDGQQVTVPLCTFHVNLYVHVVCCDTLWNWKVLCGKTVNNCMCLLCAMAYSMWHTASIYRSTRSVGGCKVPSCQHCTSVPIIPHFPYSEHGHWM